MQNLEDWLTRPGGLGTRLRDLRARAGLSGVALARDAGGWASSKVSRIESGQQLPTENDVAAWVKAVDRAAPHLGAVEHLPELQRLREDAQALHVETRHRLRTGMGPVQLDYEQLTQDSHTVRVCSPSVVPGLLQTAAYARGIMGAIVGLGLLPAGDVEAATAARLARQPVLYTDRRFDFLIGEPALRWLLIDPADMRAQLDRLLSATTMPNVRLGVMSFGRPVRVMPVDTFEVYHGPDGALSASETSFGESFYRGARADGHDALMDRLWEQAVEGDEARAIILGAAARLP